MSTNAAHKRWWQIFEVIFGVPFLAGVGLQLAAPVARPPRVICIRHRPRRRCPCRHRLALHRQGGAYPLLQHDCRICPGGTQWDPALMQRALANLTAILAHVPVYRLRCRPEPAVIPLVRSLL